MKLITFSKTLKIVLCCLICSVSFAQTNQYKTDRLLIKLKQGKSALTKATLKSQMKASTIKVFPQLEIELWEIDKPQNMDILQLVSEYSQHPDIEFVEPDYIYKTSATTPNDTLFGAQWGANNTGQIGGIADVDIDAPEAWDIATSSPSIVVGIIDTGIDWTHEDLGDNIWQNKGEDVDGDGQVLEWNGNTWIFDPDDENGIDNDGNGYIDDFVGWDFKNNDNNPMDGNLHGTHVAGVIGARGNNGIGIAGVSWEVQLAALKFLDDNGYGSTSDAIEALNYAVLMDMPVSNNSWGANTYSSSTFYAALQNAESNGHLFVAAAGNGSIDAIGDDNDTYPFYPASYDTDNVISVTSIDYNDALADFANYGMNVVDIAAPGESIYSCLPQNDYNYVSGTSTATPYITGACALLMERYPTTTYSEIKTAILNSSVSTPALAGKCESEGRLNLYKAITYFEDSLTCRYKDSLVLVEFYNAAGGSWIDAWNLNSPMDFWVGVELNDKGCVSEIDLREKNVSMMNLPPELGDLLDLTFLELYENQINGEIPVELGNLTNLIWLNLGKNQLSGSIPTELSYLDSLLWLNLRDNQLIGGIPPGFGNMTDQFFLYLQNNNLSGCFDENLMNLCNQSGIDVNVGGNQFDTSWENFCNTGVGSCPQISCRYKDSLVLVDIYNSTNGGNWINTWNLSQPLDNWYGVTLDETGCVTDIVMGLNNMTGELPTSIGDLDNLRMLGLGGNNIAGNSIPIEISNLENLTNLGLGGNGFIGEIPSELGSLYNLEQLWLSGNQLDGSLPSELGNLTELTHLIIDDNQLSGGLPASLSNMTALRYWDISNNNFSGCYPDELSVLCTRLHPDFSINEKTSNGNNLDAPWEDFCSSSVGSCSQSCRQRDSLALVAFHNAAGGSWNNTWNLNQPMETWSGVSLNANGCVDVIDMSEKNLTMTLPSELGDLLDMTGLYLDENTNISGPIPPELGNLTNLITLGLSYNQLSGEIPAELANIAGLNYLYLGHNNLTGAIPEALGELNNLIRMWLNSNQLSSEIPTQLGDISALTSLKLNYNQLTGNIPAALGNLTNLTDLQLYGNDLSGCFDENLLNLCSQLGNTLFYIDSGNQFDALWEDFCNNSDGMCEELVWPGDFNNDGIVANNDVLLWGFAAGNLGPLRPNATTDWIGQECPDWGVEVNGINGKYQDGDGNGIIDTSDLQVLLANYGNVHTLASLNDTLNSTSTLRLVPLSDLPLSDTSVQWTYEVYLGEPGQAVSGHGISFSIDVSALNVINASIDVSNSSLEPQEFIEVFDEDNRILNVGLTRTDGINKVCIEPILTFDIIIVGDIPTGTGYNIELFGGSLLTNGYVEPINNAAFVAGAFANIAGGNINVTASVIQEECGAKVSTQVTGGTAPYTFTWSHGATTATVFGLPAGLYELTVSDALGQNQIIPIEIEGSLIPINTTGGNVPDCAEVKHWVNPEICVLLEGAYDTNTGIMNSALQQMEALPDGHPFNQTPWNYAGNEGEGWTAESYASGTTDWVLVSFRINETPDSEIARTAAILMENGCLYFPDTEVLSIDAADSVYVVIEHRNHIAVMTPQPIAITNGKLVYDFRTSESYASPGGFGQKQLPDGKWTMFTGDCYQNEPGYDINGQDKATFSSENGLFGAYFLPDFNLDGEVNGGDKALWFGNNGISSGVLK